MFIYEIERGDTLYNIAKSYNVSVDDIAKLNNIDSNETLVVGQAIVIPQDYIRYSVARGDSLYRIARRYGVTIDDILAVNPDITGTIIYPNQIINIPYNAISPRDVVVNAYMLPGISTESLNSALPYLDYLSIFSYEVMPDGSLREVMDERYIDIALNRGIKPLMVVTNINSNGFSSETAHQLFTNPTSTANFIQNVISVMNEKGYYGLNVDFEYLYPEDKDNYINFLRMLSTVLKQNGYILAVAVAPKESANQVGLLYEAHDYKTIGEIADIVIIMTYEWGYLYGEPQAISPANRIENVISYAVTDIPSDKILLGVSNYAYDWTLPYVSGTPAMYLSNMQALNLARNKGSFIMFDSKAQSPYFTYYNNGAKHIVWFEDVRSLLAKLNIVEKYNLLGISYWNINFAINPSGLLVTKNN